jgi:hypothetical protein
MDELLAFDFDLDFGFADLGESAAHANTPGHSAFHGHAPHGFDLDLDLDGPH